MAMAKGDVGEGRGVGRDRGGEERLQSLLLLLLLSLQVSDASHGTEMVIARNQRAVEIQKIQKNFFLNRSIGSKGFRKGKDTTKK